MASLSIALGGITFTATLYDTPTAEALLAALPLAGKAQVWGEEIYFPIPLDIEVEPDAREEVAPGELGYWPDGPAFCIFFGPTPVSQGDEIRAASVVNVFGRIEGDASAFKQVPDGAAILVEKAAENEQTE